MSTGKKKGGIARKNYSQQRSTESSDSGKKGLKRVDKGASSKEEVRPRGINRKDKNQKSSEPTKQKAITRVDKNAPSNEAATKPKAIKRVDKNETRANEEKKVVKRTNKMQQISSEEQGSQGIKRVNKNKVAVQEEKRSARAGTKDRNVQCTTEKKVKGVTRSAKMNQSSDSLGLNKEKAPKKKMGGASSAFSQSVAGEEPKKKIVTRTGKMNQTSASLGMESNQKSTQRKPIVTKTAHHTTSADIFGSKNKQPAAAKSKQINHMQSSFTFG